MKTQYIEKLDKKIRIDESGNYIYLFVGKQGDVIDIHTDFVHSKSNIVSNIVLKAILFENSKFNVYGNLRIEKGAKNVDSYLKIDVLMMSDKASTEAIPSLEVMEDSVKGGHGASIGPVDKEQVGYLMSRGMSKIDAEKIVAEGFVQDIINYFDKDKIPQLLQDQLLRLK
jgi:Fe-S cluster assembly protein SufD